MITILHPLPRTNHRQSPPEAALGAKPHRCRISLCLDPAEGISQPGVCPPALPNAQCTSRALLHPCQPGNTTACLVHGSQTLCKPWLSPWASSACGEDGCSRICRWNQRVFGNLAPHAMGRGKVPKSRAKAWSTEISRSLSIWALLPASITSAGGGRWLRLSRQPQTQDSPDPAQCSGYSSIFPEA